MEHLRNRRLGVTSILETLNLMLPCSMPCSKQKMNRSVLTKMVFRSLNLNSKTAKAILPRLAVLSRHRPTPILNLTSASRWTILKCSIPHRQTTISFMEKCFLAPICKLVEIWTNRLWTVPSRYSTAPILPW